ncbi:putative beta-N-acetylglucosaminidase [Leptodontidium sp. MPI-SDFR-AT-0119]|nr:putative beta-N-acetylglucosaminidase [Leptodontidium sp. MPI-SDFR-AT-0119]
MTSSTSTPWSEEELRSKVGQLFIVGFHGHVASEDIKTLIRTHKVGAVILFLRNVNNAAQLLELTNSLQDTAKEAGHKQGLFIAIDQENGLVTRIKSPVAAQLPGSMALGATGNANNAYKIASATAETLKSFGINTNYAPIADVNSEPKNPVIGVRSPSDNPEAVGRFVSAQIKGLSEGGVIPCVKHFPGHGDTAVDSHYGLPVIAKSKAQLDACELVPFRRAVVEGVDSVMTAHIAMPGIGDLTLTDDHPSKKLPASLNPAAIKILREEMKYDGMIISDCLEMDGVRATFGTEKGAVMALKAGTDCVMICHTMSAQVGAINLVIEAVKSGELSQDDIQASVTRVEALKSKYVNNITVPLSTLENADTRNSRQAALASEVYAKSTTVVRSVAGSFPIVPSSTQNIVFISPGKTPAGGGAVESGEEKTREPYTPSTYIDLLRVQDPRIADVRFHDGIPLSPMDEKLIAEADILIYATRNASLSLYQKDYGLSLGRKFGENLILIATCDPYDFLEEKDEIKNYITIYEPTIPAFKSAVDIIFGIAKPLGSLPVGSPAASHDIRPFSMSDEDVLQLWKLWQEIFPKWPLELRRLAKILEQDHGHHFIHEKGFVMSYFFSLNGSNYGKITAVGVLLEYRGNGLGTALISKARKALTEGSNLKSLQFGSVFPRFWPAVPIDFHQSNKDFLLHRGFQKPVEPTARDFYRSIKEGEIAPPDILARVSKLPLKFAPWSPELYDECITKQRANFKNIGWVEAYERLAAANQHHEVMVAFDAETNAQLGWTLMCSPSAVVLDDFAFINLLPSKDNTGLIGCVGVDKAARGKGVGLALLVKAIENMKERDVEGVMIDWVTIRGFYEHLGFEVAWEYETFEW